VRRLILRPGGIGDCILALPALEHLRSAYTEVWISSPLVPLITIADCVRSLSSTGIDLVGIADREMAPALRTHLQSFDSIISWYGSARPEFRTAIEELAVPCEFLAALPPCEYAAHTTAFFSAQVGAADALPCLSAARAVSLPDVVLHPFSGGARKNWPLAKYRELADRLPAVVHWNAGPEEALAEAERFDDLGALASWLAGARLYIGNDSGITHLAAALGVKTLALFGPTDPLRWAPRGANVHVLRHEPLEELAVKTVCETATRLLLA